MRWPVCLLVILSAALVRSQDTVRTMFPPVRGLHEMVGAANNLEVAAGMRMLAQGGNAVDAGVATVLAATVTEQSRVGLGGEIPILIKMIMVRFEAQGRLVPNMFLLFLAACLLLSGALRSLNARRLRPCLRVSWENLL